MRSAPEMVDRLVPLGIESEGLCRGIIIPNEEQAERTRRNPDGTQKIFKDYIDHATKNENTDRLKYHFDKNLQCIELTSDLDRVKLKESLVSTKPVDVKRTDDFFEYSEVGINTTLQSLHIAVRDAKSSQQDESAASRMIDVLQYLNSKLKSSYLDNAINVVSK